MPKLSKRDLILKVATKHFAKYGYDRTVLDEIAKECNLSKPAIYYHFKNKSMLYKEIICDFFTRVSREIELKTRNKNPLDALESYVRVFGEFFIQEPHFSSIFAKELSFGSSNIKECVIMLQSILSRLVQILDDGYKEGLFEKENPFMIQLMIISTLTNYNTTRELREHITAKLNNLDGFEPKLEGIVDNLAKKILKAVRC